MDIFLKTVAHVKILNSYYVLLKLPDWKWLTGCTVAQTGMSEVQLKWSNQKLREEISYCVSCDKVATGILFTWKPKQFYFIYVQTTQFAVKIE